MATGVHKLNTSVTTLIIENNIAHGPTYWAEEIAEEVTKKLISISSTAPPEVKLQAEAFRNQIHQMVYSVSAEVVRRALAAEQHKLLNLGG